MYICIDNNKLTCIGNIFVEQPHKTFDSFAPQIIAMPKAAAT